MPNSFRDALTSALLLLADEREVWYHGMVWYSKDTTIPRYDTCGRPGW